MNEILIPILTVILTGCAITILLMHFKIKELKRDNEICANNYVTLLKRTQSENDTYLESKHTKRRM